MHSQSTALSRFSQARERAVQVMKQLACHVSENAREKPKRRIKTVIYKINAGHEKLRDMSSHCRCFGTVLMTAWRNRWKQWPLPMSLKADSDDNTPFRRVNGIQRNVEKKCDLRPENGNRFCDVVDKILYTGTKTNSRSFSETMKESSLASFANRT